MIGDVRALITRSDNELYGDGRPVWVCIGGGETISWTTVSKKVKIFVIATRINIPGETDC
jgi:hypothetical protein